MTVETVVVTEVLHLLIVALLTLYSKKSYCNAP